MEIVQYKDSKEWGKVNYEFRLVVGNNLLKNGIIKLAGLYYRNLLIHTYTKFKLELK